MSEQSGNECKALSYGAPFTVKKSVFQGHLCGGLTSTEQVDVMISLLKQNSKVAKASHNMMACR
jgi:hypothetical protein